ncbi:MAG: hypothetical protein ACRELE_11655 [Gemmatimonadales bacterium]
MTALSALWLPILLSAVAVFIVSSVIHMMSPWHKSDFSRLSNEDGVMDALRPFAIAPGEYMMPRPSSAQDMKSAEYLGKRARGPVAMMTVFPSGTVGMGKMLVQWFGYLLVVSLLAAVVSSAAVGATPSDHRIFHFAGVTAFTAYAVAQWPLSIWYGRRWSTTIKVTVDGLIYALLTAAIFAWMWPR